MNWTPMQRQAAFTSLLDIFGLAKLSAFPDCDTLNTLAERHAPDLNKRFIPQVQADELDGYYEEIIAQRGVIPTRKDSWHDLFNALVWMTFPETKSRLNQLHMEDIAVHGLNPRTRRRDILTHFDECGVILAVERGDTPALLAEHAWYDAFVKQRDAWFDAVTPVIFGHANYEMLLEPFLGLTGKWLAIPVEEGFSCLPVVRQLSVLDAALCSYLDKTQQPLALKPLPLLGVPGWWQDNTDPAFYDNTDYFRPKRRPTQ